MGSFFDRYANHVASLIDEYLNEAQLRDAGLKAVPGLTVPEQIRLLEIVKLSVAHKGFIWFDITTEGVAAHGSRPDLGVDAMQVNHETGAFVHLSEGPGAFYNEPGFAPRDGSRFALDPDIPPAAQQIVFEGERGTWVLDGRSLGTGASLRWAPWPGRHELSLLDARGRVLQTVRFEVRGATLRSGG